MANAWFQLQNYCLQILKKMFMNNEMFFGFLFYLLLYFFCMPVDYTLDFISCLHNILIECV